MVSALTVLGLDEMEARYASYALVLDEIRRHGPFAERDGRELFSRLVFNVLCGNTDDHARNHAFFWDGSSIEITPAYDVCPQVRTGQEASQAMRITDGRNDSTIDACLEAAMTDRIELDVSRTIERFLSRIGRDYPVFQAVLFGSRARGDHHPESDGDLIVVLDGPPSDQVSTKLDMADIAYEIMLETGILISPFPVWKAEWANPVADDYLMNAREEGVRF